MTAHLIAKLQTAVVRLTIISLMTTALFIPQGFVQSNPIPDTALDCELVVLSKADDPYFVLAQEIASAEDAPIFQNLTEALSCQPVFLLWVISPGSLSDSVMVDFGQTMKAHHLNVSSGIITGSTLEHARSLWQQRSQVRGQQMSIVNARFPSAHIEEGKIISIRADQASVGPLQAEHLIAALQSSDYLTYTGHGASKYLRLDEESTLTADMVPAINALVISTGSCQTVRLWDKDSIALQFIDQGAAAYSGFVYSPMEGYLIGEFDSLPFRYTWPDFPIGHAVQIQQHGTLQGFAEFPFHVLLGDPRIALQSQAPYQLVEDRQEGKQRILRYQAVSSGVLPVRIPNGVDYHFVEAPGITAAADADPFYNSKLQMVNIQNDKYLLVVQPGGELTLRLSPQPPWYWFFTDPVLDALDHTTLFNQQSGGDFIALFFAVIPLVWTGIHIIKKKLKRNNIHMALLFGATAVILNGLYIALRLGYLTINSKLIVFSPLSLAATFLLGTGGTLIFFHASKPIGKAVGLLIITFNCCGPALINSVVITAFNQLAAKPEIGSGIYNYSLALLPAIAWVISLALAAAGLKWVNRLRKVL